MTNAYEHERTRLSRELHDDIAQRIGRLSIELGLRRQRLTKPGGGTVVEAHLPIRQSFAVARPA